MAGIANGITESIHTAESKVAYMAKKITGTVDDIFSGYQVADIAPNLNVGAEISNDIETRLKRDNMRREMQEKDEEDEPISLTVKIGEDTILDRIVNGINEKSFMNNMGVISV